VRSTTDLQANPSTSMRKKDNNDVIKLEFVKRINIPSKYSLNQKGSRKEVFELPNEGDDDLQRIHVDNKGDVFIINEERDLFMINDIDAWDSLKSTISETKTTFDMLNFFKFGQGHVVFKHEEEIFTAKYTNSKLTKSKKLKHKALDICGECDIVHLVLPKTQKYVIFFYEIYEAMTIIVWDMEKDIEHSHFLGRKKDSFVDYVAGKNSKLGLVWFKEYIVDLDLCIPIPFMTKKNSTSCQYWTQGIRINSNEDILLSCGTIVTPLCYKDIYYHKSKSLTDLDVQKIVSILT